MHKIIQIFRKFGQFALENLKLHVFIQERCDGELARSLKLLQHKECSVFLRSKPSKEHGFYLNRQQFHDTMAIRYGWNAENVPSKCQCGAANSIDHALCYKLGGFIHMRHDTIRDLEAEFLNEVAYNVQTVLLTFTLS